MVFAADGAQVVDVGAAVVAVPLLDLVEFATVQGGTAFEASSGPDRYGEPVCGVGAALLAAQPEGMAARSKSSPPARCPGQRLEELPRYGTDPDHPDVNLASVPSNTHR